MERIEDQNIAFEQQKAEFREIIQKIDKKNPDKTDIQKAEAMIRRNPSLWEITMGVAGSTLKRFLDKLATIKSQQLIIEAETLSIKESLGYNSSNQIEKLIIDQVLFCWAGVNYAENHVFTMLTEGGMPLSTLNYWQETLSRYQNRYLRAIETLARVRKLNKGIAFQVNIATNGGQQVNVNERAKE